MQVVVEHNRAVFEPDANAISEALETFRDNEGNNNLHSFDSSNDQENQDLHSHMQANCGSDEESFNEQVPLQLAQKITLIVYQQFQQFQATFNQQKFLMPSSLNKKQCIAYDTILSW